MQKKFTLLAYVWIFLYLCRKFNRKIYTNYDCTRSILFREYRWLN